MLLNLRVRTANTIVIQTIISSIHLSDCGWREVAGQYPAADPGHSFSLSDWDHKRFK
jgi:hypothetical protein